MNVEAIYINAYKYDFSFAKICIASIRYWHPEVRIVLIKDTGSGDFDTRDAEQRWNVEIFKTSRKKFGWGFGKWEPLFLGKPHSFLVMDADTAITGPILDEVKTIEGQFIVDEEVQPLDRFNEIYYKLDRIKEVNHSFEYPGYSFNEGQWFGTSGLLSRADFEPILEWTQPPTPKFPGIILQGAQGHLNYMLHLKQQLGELSITRKKIMIWPDAGSAGFIDLEKIRKHQGNYPFIIHWAGFKFSRFSELPRFDIIKFYQDYYYSGMGKLRRSIDEIRDVYLPVEKKAKKNVKRVKNLLRRITK